MTRSLRGGRAKRYIILSLVLASLTGIVGLWLALGSGRFEQSLRVELGLEQHEFERERETFTVYAHSEWELRDFQRSLDSLEHESMEGRYYNSASGLYDWGRSLTEQAAFSPAWGSRNLELRERAREQLNFDDWGGISQRDLDGPNEWDNVFPWGNPEQVAALERVLDHGGIPSAAMYRSPLGFGDALKLTGFMAGLLLAALGTVFAPLLVAVSQAQERHENTLMPLTGTALSPRELVLGLASGPSSVIAIFAAPQLVIFLVCALFAGEVFVAGAFLAALLATSALFVFGGQLLGQLTGHKRTPGVVGMSLMCLAGVAWMLGAGLAADGDHDVAGFAAVLPHIGLSALLAEVFVEIEAQFGYVFVASFVWTGGAVLLGWLTMTALARKIEGNEGPLLRRGEAMVGVAACIVLVNVALPDSGRDSGAIALYFGLGMLAMPLALLLMGRVPLGDGTPRMRAVPLLSLLMEFGAWAVAHIVFAGMIWGVDANAMHPVAVMWLAWCVGVLGLISIRVVAVPGKAAANVWAGFCSLALAVGYGQAVYWGMENKRLDIDDVFVLMQASPVLGLAQIALTIWIPMSLVRHLRKNLGRIS